MPYLIEGETLESRLDTLLGDARATGNITLKTSLFAEAQVVATMLSTPEPLGPAQTFTFHGTPSSPAEVGETLGEPVYTLDDIAAALDATFEGGSAPTVLRAAFLAMLAAEPGDEPETDVRLGVTDTAALDLADGEPTPRLLSEKTLQPYVDLGKDVDVETDDLDPDDIAEDDAEEDFEEFRSEAGSLDGSNRSVGKKARGSKKAAAARLAEEAGA